MPCCRIQNPELSDKSITETNSLFVAQKQPRTCFNSPPRVPCNCVRDELKANPAQLVALAAGSAFRKVAAEVVHSAKRRVYEKPHERSTTHASHSIFP